MCGEGARIRKGLKTQNQMNIKGEWSRRWRGGTETEGSETVEDEEVKVVDEIVEKVPRYEED